MFSIMTSFSINESGPLLVTLPPHSRICVSGVTYNGGFIGRYRSPSVET